MKKLFTVLSILLLFGGISNAQTIFSMGDLLTGGDSLTESDQVIYFKFTIKDTSEVTNIDLGLCLSKDSVKAFGDYVGQLRVREDLHYFDVRDQGNLLGQTGNYHFEETVEWQADVIYHAWMLVDLSFHIYDVYIVDGSDPMLTLITLAEGAGCRNQATALRYWSVVAAGTVFGGYIDIDTVAFVQEVGDYPPVLGSDIETLTGNNNNLNVFPLPAQDYVNVSFDLKNTAEVELSLIDITGQEVMNLESKSIDGGVFSNRYYISGLSKGLYLIKLVADGIPSSIQKIVVN